MQTVAQISIMMLSIATIIVIMIAGAAANAPLHQYCSTDDPNIQLICRRNLFDLYDQQLTNTTARLLYRSYLLDMLLNDTRPSCFAFQMGRFIFQANYPKLWDSLWIKTSTDPAISPPPCREIVTILQTTFAKYGGMSIGQLHAMSNHLIQDGCGCSADDIQCKVDLPAILFLLWDDPNHVGILDLDAAWANNDDGAQSLITMIQKDYTWTQQCPM